MKYANISKAINSHSEVWQPGPVSFPGSSFNATDFLNETGNNATGQLYLEYMDTTAEYIFDRGDVRIAFLIVYSIVFLCCFFGNLMVILVVTLHYQMRSTTNFCLANLAVADMCVGIFCVYQNIVTYLMDSWIFGEFMCKMYHFINSLSTTASVLILVVICIERYFAIIYPILCKRIMTLKRLQVTILFVWILSATISSPRFYYFSTINMPLPNNRIEILCLPNRTKYHSKLFDMISMTVLFLIPLIIITVLYTHVAIVLWKCSRQIVPTITNPSINSNNSDYSDESAKQPHSSIVQMVKLTIFPVATSETKNPEGLTTHCSGVNPCASAELGENCASSETKSDENVNTSSKQSRRITSVQNYKYGTGALQSRRKVIKMLVVVVVTFTLCHFPFHARKVWQYWSPAWAQYQAGDVFSTLLTPVTFLIMYANSAINPILYAFMSKKFQNSFRDLLRCKIKSRLETNRHI